MAKSLRTFFQRALLGFMLLCIAVLFLWSENQAEAASEYTSPLITTHPETKATLASIETDGSGRPADADHERAWDMPNDIIGINDIVFQPESGPIDVEDTLVKDAITFHDTEKLHDFEYLVRHFYSADSNAGLLPADINVDAFLKANLSIDNTITGPKILIFHTHSTEMYADSILRETTYDTDPMEGVMGTGRKLAQLLTEQYGIDVLHHVGRYDIVNGKAQISGAYERMEPAIRQLLADNPSIQLVIDLHRDGLRDGVPPMVTDINGSNAARIMFVNGLSRTKQNNEHTPVPWLENPYVTQNLQLSFQMQLHTNERYPGLARKVYLKPYRYSLHLLPRTLLVEVGAQNNTKQEAANAMEPFAEILAQVILK